MSEWKIAGCVREDGEWHHLPTRTGAKGFVSTWDISKEILDIAERALELLEIANRYMHGDFDGVTFKVAALLDECSGDKPKQPTVVNQMDPCDEWASLIILADEVDKLKGQLEKDDL
jgi:hypothetical protein